MEKKIEQKETVLTSFGRMAKIKEELSKMKMNKSGVNSYAKFKYYELQDFLPYINQLNGKWGVCENISLDSEKKIVSIQLINVDDPNDFYTVQFPYIEAQMLGAGGTPSSVEAIQRMGATITYNRRYAYMLAYGIVENDGVDSLEPVKEVKKESKPVKEVKKESKPMNTEDRKKVPTNKEMQVFEWGKVNGKSIDDLLKVYDLTFEQELLYQDHLKKK